MIHQLALASVFFASGCLAGLGHFSLLALQVRALVRQSAGALTGCVRIAITLVAFLAAAMAGAFALIAALTGFIAARTFTFRHAGSIWQ